jgi:MFS family permease
MARTSGEESAAAADGSEKGLRRLLITTAVALLSFIGQTIPPYLLPLYFSAKGMLRSAWETWSLYEILAWLLTPPLAGLLAARFGENRIWGAGLLGYVAVGFGVKLLPVHSPAAAVMLSGTALLWGISSAAVWVGAIALVQNVPERLRGTSNAMMMAALGAGSIAGPLVGRVLVRWRSAGLPPRAQDFVPALVVFSGLSLLGACLVLALGSGPKPPSRLSEANSESRPPTGAFRQGLALLRNPKYLGLVVSLSLLGGPVFRATDVYRPYRVRDAQIGLIVGAQDHGWAALEVAGNAMQLVGGLLIGLFAGKKASGWLPVVILSSYAFCALGIGLAPTALILFVCSCLFELVRQFMRWAQTGYVSEQVPKDQRTQAIGFSVTLSGTGALGFNFLMSRLQSPDSPDFSSTLPFVIGAALGAIGVAILVGMQFRHMFQPIAVE